ncbi:MAG: hypothetical protein J0I93_07830 [Legionella sp.]|nr:hypothetical protein [Legionella sp.]
MDQLIPAINTDWILFDNQSHPRLRIVPIYYQKGFSDRPQIYGRRTVLEKLLLALEHLPVNVGLQVWDVYRPRAVQQKLFLWMQEEIRKKFPHFNENENFQETVKYVSLPSKPGEDYCAPHLSGGAVDLTLFELSTGQELAMGTPFDDCTARAHIDYFQKHKPQNPEEKQINQHRLLLQKAMQQVGFTSYRYEWWHYDYGTIFWARETGRQPLYGPLFGLEEWPNNDPYEF